MGAFGFLSPWMLAALAALPVIWLLLRLTPPRPRRIDFPPTRILLGLADKQRTPARSPWWLTALRLLLVALVIGALAEPILRPDLRLTAGKEPLLVLLDNGWDSAPDFADRMAAARTALAEAARDSRPASLVATAEPNPDVIAAQEPAKVAERLAALAPRPYLPDRSAVAGRLMRAFGERSVEVLWIASPLGNGASALAAAVGRIAARSTIIQSNRPFAAMRPPQNGANAVKVPIVRSAGGGSVAVAGFDAEGRRIVQGAAAISSDGRGVAEIALPAELRNSLARFEAEGEASAGAVQLLDSRWRRKAVGLVQEESAGGSQPLLEPLTYVERALSPTADLMRSDAASASEAVMALIKRSASVIVLTQTGTLPPETTAALVAWVESGGTLLRFASPNLAATTVDSLLPVRLRQGEREIGGSLSWEEPQPIGDFPANSPFSKLAVPADVRVNRQVLADPDALRDAEVWAELRDGTPLVTAAKRGAGRIVLFHVTADPRWSNLPLSGTFVDMLNSIVQTAGVVSAPAGAKAAEAPDSVGRNAAAPWKPAKLLDGFGRLRPPDATAALVADIATAHPSATTPPGLYDRDGASFALNSVDDSTDLSPLAVGSIGWKGGRVSLEPHPATPLWPWLLAAAALLAALDGLAVLALSGRLRMRSAAAAAIVALAFGLGLATAPGAKAQPTGAENQAVQAATQTHLAYVVTGNAELDDASRAGLEGLSMYLAQRTALEPADPVALNLDTDELAFYALIYWPIDANETVPTAATMAKVDAFLKNGGTILFDTRDAGGFSRSGLDTATPEVEKLRQILAFIDVPPLEPAPPDHVLTKAFYLLTDFPGRWDNSDLWVESLSDAPQQPGRPARGGDGVSPILITGNDLAGAWAVDKNGLYLYPTTPSEPRQRELAFRAGVNIVMYALTGNYKADQVHVPALLERLGQ